MNNNIKEMIHKGILIAGRLDEHKGFYSFIRLPIEEVEQLDDSVIAFATRSMGRSVFQVEPNGKIRNVKGIDTHFKNEENAVNVLSQAKEVFLTTDGRGYEESTHPINLTIFPGEKPDIRIRGASPFEDLKIEEDVNGRLEKIGVKVPKIKSVKEYPSEIAEKIGLPIKIAIGPGEVRNETINEFFKRKGIYLSPVFSRFASENGFTIDDFTSYVDKTYPEGQNYGQTIRILDSPFRISDIEYYLKLGDKEKVNLIAEFTNETMGTDFENVFASSLGTNLALMMNTGWTFENLDHRQDYTLAGEMTDDSYFNLPVRLQQLRQELRSDPGKFEALSKDLIEHFYTGIFLMSSNIKVLKDEMELRGKGPEEISAMINSFTKSFTEKVDYRQIAQVFGTTAEDIEKKFKIMLGKRRDYPKILASARRPNGKVYDEQVLLAHQGNNDFYNEIAGSIANELHLTHSIEQDDSHLEDLE